MRRGNVELTGGVDIARKPEEKGIVDKLCKEETQREFDHALFERSTDVMSATNGLVHFKQNLFDKIVPECEELGQIRWPSPSDGSRDC